MRMQTCTMVISVVCIFDMKYNSVSYINVVGNKRHCVLPLKHRITLIMLLVWTIDFGIAIMKFKDSGK
jgi:hypothetical protein